MHLGLKCKQATSTTFRSECLLAAPEHSASKQLKCILWCLFNDFMVITIGTWKKVYIGHCQ